MTDERKTVEIYIDTSIKGPKRRDGSGIYILAFTTISGKTADRGGWIREKDTTENHLTLMGLEEALKHLRKPCSLILHLECPYVAHALQNRWYDGWEVNGWMTGKKIPVTDSEKWRSIQYLLNEHKFEVSLKQDHPYRAWMRRELASDAAASGRKGEKDV